MAKGVPIVAGDRFGMWKVYSGTPIAKGRHQYYKCICACGNKAEVVRGNLINGDSRSCGCSSKSGDPRMKIVKTKYDHGIDSEVDFTPIMELINKVFK